MTLNGVTFASGPYTIYSTNYTLVLKALLSDQPYFVTVQASTPYTFNNATNITSAAIRVRHK